MEVRREGVGVICRCRPASTPPYLDPKPHTLRTMSCLSASLWWGTMVAPTAWYSES